MDSEEENQDEELKPQTFAFDEAFGEEEDENQNADQLMEVDGISYLSKHYYLTPVLTSYAEGPSNAVVLHEDKQYYPSAKQVYGDEVETLVQEEDSQPLSQPIIAPVQQKKFSIEEADLPPVHFSREFMTDLLSFPSQIRNIALVGHLHHGKTAA